MNNKKIRLLVLEDNKDDAALLLHTIKSGDFQVDSECIQTAEALKRCLQNKQLDIIISDFQMLQFDARQALAIIQDFKIDIPFIIVSGTIGEVTAVEAMKAGASDYIMKDKLGRLIPALNRELREAENRKKLKDSEERFRQAQKMESIGRFAGGIAHDFNNVLAVILTYCELLQRRLQTTDPTYKPIEQIKKSAERAAAITKQLLAFSRKQILEPRIVNINSILLNLEQMLKRLLGEDVQLTVEVQPDIWNVNIDPTQFEQVIMNLAVNARDAMPRGGKLIIKTANCTLDEKSSDPLAVSTGPYVQISVQDFGCGMDSITKEKIFEPFFTTKDSKHGTGLGLSTVEGIVKQSHGSITVDSEPGKGTTFKIYLPQCNLANVHSVDAKENLNKQQNVRPANSKNILLIEDEETLREAFQEMLFQQKYNVIVVSSGKEALEFFKKGKQNIDLLITDIVMPEMSGPEVAKHLREQDPKLKVLFVSGYMDETLDRHIKLGANTYFLQKPFLLEQLLKKMQEVWDAR